MRAGTRTEQLPSASTSASPRTCFTSKAPLPTAMGVPILPCVECQPYCQFQPMWTGRYSRPTTRSFFTHPFGAPFIAAPA